MENVETNIDEVLIALKKYGKKAEEAIKIAVDKTSLLCESDAKLRLRGELGSAKHWVTGRLASSIHAKLRSNQGHNYKDDEGKQFEGSLMTPVGKMEAVVGTNVIYAEKIEELDPFIGFAAVNRQNSLKELTIKELNKIKND